MKKFSAFKISVFVLTIFLCASVGMLVSTGILSSSLLLNSIKTQKNAVFCIYFYENENKNALKDSQQNLQNQNGAGYILEKDGKFFLIASVYQNEADAQKVQKNLKANGTESEILKVEFEQNSVEGNFSAQESKIFQDSLSLDFETYKSLYNISVSFDTNLISKDEAKMQCNDVYSKVISVKTNFDTFILSHNEIKQNLQKTQDVLSDLVCERYENIYQNFSSLIKFSYCKLLFE